jgi:hypothetical protein
MSQNATDHPRETDEMGSHPIRHRNTPKYYSDFKKNIAKSGIYKLRSVMYNGQARQRIQTAVPRPLLRPRLAAGRAGARYGRKGNNVSIRKVTDDKILTDGFVTLEAVTLYATTRSEALKVDTSRFLIGSTLFITTEGQVYLLDADGGIWRSVRDGSPLMGGEA